MPRSGTKVRRRAAVLAVEGRVEGQGEDAGRTPARVDYVRREIRRRLKRMAEIEAQRGNDVTTPETGEP